MAAFEAAVGAGITPPFARTRLVDQSAPWRALASLLKVVISDRVRALELTPDAAAVDGAPKADRSEERVLLARPNCFAKTRNSTTLIPSGGVREACKLDRALNRALSRARARKLEAGTVRSVAALARDEKLCPIYTTAF